MHEPCQVPIPHPDAFAQSAIVVCHERRFSTTNLRYPCTYHVRIFPRIAHIWSNVLHLFAYVWSILLVIGSLINHLHGSSFLTSNLQPRRLPALQSLHSIAANQEWRFTDSLHEARWGHTATPLPDGRVLVAGGTELRSAEVYDPATETWETTGSMNEYRVGHTATLLTDGTVLVTGGFAGVAVASAEVYTPATGTWRAVGKMGTARGGHTATLLADGRVLVTGGYNHPSSYYASAEIYDPSTETWHNTTSMSEPRMNHTATRLSDGTVLVVGGYIAGRFQTYSPYTTEVYNPTTQAWQRVESLNTGRGYHTATRLSNGTVLVAGGLNASQGQRQILATTEVYDPATASWRMGPRLQEARQAHAATILPSGLVLVVGGLDTAALASAEVYDLNHNVWYRLPDLHVARLDHTLTFVAPDTLLVTGGRDSGASIASSEIYQVSDIPSFGPQIYLPLMTKQE